MPSEVNISDTASGKDNGGDESEEQTVALLTVSTTNQDSSATVKHVETNTIKNNNKAFTSEIQNDFIEQTENASLPLDTNYLPTENGLQAEASSCQRDIIDQISDTNILNSLEEQDTCPKSKCNKENAILKVVACTTSASVGEIEDSSISSKLNNEVTQNLSQRLISLSHKNLTRKKGYLANAENSTGKIVNISEQLPLSSRNMIRKKQFFSKDLQSSSMESQFEQNTRDQHNNNEDNIFSDNNRDSCGKDCSLPLESLASCSFDEQSQFQSTSISEVHSNIINAHKPLSLAENNNKSICENLSKLNEAGSSFSHVSKSVPKSQNTLADLVYCNDITRKPFKLPILENLHETASAQQIEFEENAIALLEPSSNKQVRLEEAQGIEIEPHRSSNSSDASNSDTESQQAVLGHNGTKKV